MIRGAALLIVAGCWTQPLPSKTSESGEAELLAEALDGCKTDDDCTLIDDCCGCRRNGRRIVMRKDVAIQREAMRAKLCANATACPTKPTNEHGCSEVDGAACDRDRRRCIPSIDIALARETEARVCER